MVELEPCPVCGAPGIFHNPKRSNRQSYEVCCSRNPDHLDVRHWHSGERAIEDWNLTCRARRDS